MTTNSKHAADPPDTAAPTTPAPDGSPTPFRTIAEALDYLFRFTNYENMGRVNYSRTSFDLDRMRRLLAACGHPDRQVPILAHVAGTKGKGSTCHMAAALLQGAGLRTGLYTSPHLEDLRERITVGGNWISEDALRRHISSLRSFLDGPHDPLPPTFFDIITAIGLTEFAEQRCNAAVIEVGLGGRLDSTNVIHPQVTAITRIDYDHIDKLGSTLTLIATEKAGILKPDVPAVLATQPEEAAAVFRNRVHDLSIPAWWIGREIRIEDDRTESAFTVVTPVRRHEAVSLSVLGRHQRENAAVALGIVDWLAERQHIPLDPGLEQAALASLTIPGRIELFPGSPRVILDGAHNAISAHALAKTIRESLHYNRLFLILGIARDKAVPDVVRELAPTASRVLATASRNPRAMPPEELAQTIRTSFNVPVTVYDHPSAALNDALQIAGHDDLVVIAGSFYLAGELRPCIRQRARKVP